MLLLSHIVPPAALLSVRAEALGPAWTRVCELLPYAGNEWSQLRGQEAVGSQGVQRNGALWVRRTDSGIISQLCCTIEEMQGAGRSCKTEAQLRWAPGRLSAGEAAGITKNV